jgi:hypothetical protein
LTSSLRDHIGKYHLELYMTLAREEGWRTLLPRQAAKEDEGEDL